MLPEPVRRFSTHLDFPGQKAAERTFQVVMVLSGIMGFLVGFSTHRLSHAIYTVLLGVFLSALIVLPLWPLLFRKNRTVECKRILSKGDASNVQESDAEQPEARTSFHQPTSEEQTRAATKIQAWWRGCLVRAELREDLHRRRSYMVAYLSNVAAEQSEAVDNVALDALPVHAKIHDAVEMLFDSKMYITKVGAFVLNRVTALSPHLCAYFVVDAQGLAASWTFLDKRALDVVLARRTSCPFWPRFFYAWLRNAFQCQEATVEAEVSALLEDCAKSALHIFHAFYMYPQIVYLFGKAILAIHRRPEAAAYLEKAPFYLNYARRRLARYPHTDPRRAILEEMTAKMPY